MGNKVFGRNWMGCVIASQVIYIYMSEAGNWVPYGRGNEHDDPVIEACCVTRFKIERIAQMATAHRSQRRSCAQWLSAQWLSSLAQAEASIGGAKGIGAKTP